MQLWHIALKGAAEGVVRQAFPEDEVMGFPDTLSVGPLAEIGRPVAVYRRMLWMQAFYRRNGRQDDSVEYCEGLARLLAALPDADRVTVWAGDHPDELLMLHALVPYLPAGTAVASVSHHLRLDETGAGVPEILRTLEPQAAVLDPLRREYLLNTWQRLQQNNATLHFSQTGKLLAAEEDRLDEVILQRLNTRPDSTAQSLAKSVMEVTGMLVNCEWLIWRIRFLQEGIA